MVVIHVGLRERERGGLYIYDQPPSVKNTICSRIHQILTFATTSTLVQYTGSWKRIAARDSLSSIYDSDCLEFFGISQKTIHHSMLHTSLTRSRWDHFHTSDGIILIEEYLLHLGEGQQGEIGKLFLLHIPGIVNDLFQPSTWTSTDSMLHIHSRNTEETITGFAQVLCIKSRFSKIGVLEVGADEIVKTVVVVDSDVGCDGLNTAIKYFIQLFKLNLHCVVGGMVVLLLLSFGDKDIVVDLIVPPPIGRLLVEVTIVQTIPYKACTLPSVREFRDVKHSLTNIFSKRITESHIVIVSWDVGHGEGLGVSVVGHREPGVPEHVGCHLDSDIVSGGSSSRCTNRTSILNIEDLLVLCTLHQTGGHDGSGIPHAYDNVVIILCKKLVIT
jgi:hypothetical protein